MEIGIGIPNIRKVRVVSTLLMPLFQVLLVALGTYQVFKRSNIGWPTLLVAVGLSGYIVDASFHTQSVLKHVIQILVGIAFVAGLLIIGVRTMRSLGIQKK